MTTLTCAPERSSVQTVAAKPSAAAATSFSRPRFALLILASVYPLITLLLYALAPLTDGWALWQETLVVAPLMVSSMVWGIIPTVQRRFRGFLNPIAR